MVRAEAFPTPDFSDFDCSTLGSPCPTVARSLTESLPIGNMPLEQLYCSTLNQTSASPATAFQDFSFYYNRLLQINNFSTVQSYYDAIALPGGLFADGMGDATISATSHSSVRETLANFSYLTGTRQAYRSNELGRRRMNDLGWFTYPKSTYQGIGIGLPGDIHDALRPILDETMGDGSILGDLFATEGNHWTYEQLVEMSRSFLENRDTIGFIDYSVFVIMALWKIIVGLDITEAQATAFASIQFLSANLIEYPQAIAEECRRVSQVDIIRRAKQRYVNMIVDALNERRGELETIADADEDTVTSAAYAILDALFFAGGLSVPIVLRVGLREYYECSAGTESIDVSSKMDLKVMAMETIRSTPPVNSAAYINGENLEDPGKRVVALLGLATVDESVYGEKPEEFRIRGDLNYYHSRSVNFADQAGPIDGLPGTNRVCPARSLAVNMIAAFWDAAELNAWGLVDGTVTRICEDGAACPDTRPCAATQSVEDAEATPTRKICLGKRLGRSCGDGSERKLRGS